MAEMQAQSEWTVVSERRTNGPLASLNAIWTQVGHKRIYGPYDRPPFPIMVDRPSVKDLVASW